MIKGPGYFILILVLVSIFIAISVPAEDYKFPPPEFETNYQKPVTPVPFGRSYLLDYLDVLILLAVLLLGTWLVLKKRSRKGILWLSIFSLFYFGFYKEGCICPIGSIQNVALSLFNPDYLIPVSVLAVFLIPLIFTLLFGRIYCGTACPHGALQDLLLIKEVKLPKWVDRAFSSFAYIYLGLAVLFAATDTMFIICKFDPFVPFFRLTGPYYMFITGAIFLITSLFIGRPYCRFICPYGVILKILSLFSWKHMTVTPDKCVLCKLCEDVCPYNAMKKPDFKEGGNE